MDNSLKLTTDEIAEQRIAALTSLAVLKTDIDEEQRQYIDYIVPFVLAVLNEQVDQLVSDASVTHALRRKFGLGIPNKSIQYVLKRFAKTTPPYLLREGEGYVVSNDLPKSNLEERTKSAQKGTELLIEGLIGFAGTKGLTLTNNEALAALLSVLRRFGVECLKAYIFESALPEISPEEESASAMYVVWLFVQDARKSQPQLFEHLISLVKGQMYANALMCPDLASLGKKFQKVSFYIDSPVIFNLIGWHGKADEEATRELMGMLKELGGSIFVLSHSIQECQRMLKGLALNFGKQTARGRMAKHLASSGIKVTEIILKRDALEADLRGMGIKTKNTPDYTSEFQINEAEFEDVLDDEVSYLNERALLDDINSVRSMYTLRKGNSPQSLEDATAVFVTNNGAFARAAYEFGKAHNSTKEVSSVITDHSLSHVAWLKMPMGRPNLPEQELMALCYAAREPSAKMLRNYVQEIERQRDSKSLTADDHVLLRTPLAEDMLMELTLGDDASLRPQTLAQILSNIKSTLTSEKDVEIGKIQNEYDALNTRQDRLKTKLHTIVAMAAKIIVAVPALLILVMLFYASFAASSLLDWGEIGTYRKYLTTALVVIFAVLGVFALVTGTSLNRYYVAVQVGLTKKIMGFISRHFLD